MSDSDLDGRLVLIACNVLNQNLIEVMAHVIRSERIEQNRKLLNDLGPPMRQSKGLGGHQCAEMRNTPPLFKAFSSTWLALSDLHI